MPSKRLLAMGLLSKYPKKSWVLKRFLNRKKGIKYTDAEKSHITALMFTPHLPASWIEYQLQQYGEDKPEHALRSLKSIAYKPENRERWEHLGKENLMFIGQPEVEYFYLRRNPNKRVFHPSWAIPIIADHIKEGMSGPAIARKYNIHHNQVYSMLKRNMFDYDRSSRYNFKSRP